MFTKDPAYNFPSYTQMVTNLFKTDIPGKMGDLMHAAVGISGEAGELREAPNRKNLLEELGDTRFYVVAAFQRLVVHGYTYASVFGEAEKHFGPTTFKFPELTLGNVLNELSISASKCLDYTKKPWIYGNREPMAKEMYERLFFLEKIIAFLAEMHGFTMEEVEYSNQVKLIGKDGRYKSGTYSDAEALARADKKAGE